MFNNKTKKFDIKIINSHWIKENLKIENNFLAPHMNSRKIDHYINFELYNTYTFHKEGVGFIFYDDYIIETPFILEPQNKLTCFKLNNFNKKMWHFQLPEGFKIFSKIQPVQNILFFKATKGEFFDYQNTYGLDIKTGKILWESNYPKDKAIVAFNINPHDNLCYGYGGNHYQVFNPITGKILIDKDMSSYYKQGIDPDIYRNAIYDHKLWFVSGRGDNAKFGSIDLKTHKLDFLQDFPLEKDGQFDKPVCHKGKLYLRDDNKVLHIFENPQNKSL